MSTKTISKIETRMIIGFDDETKAEINALKGKLDEVARGLSAKNESHGDRLLKVMQAEATNDDRPELKEMGQWVFEGLNEKYQSAAMDDDGAVFAYECLLEDLVKNTDDGLGYWYSRTGADSVHVCTLSDGSNWEHFAIQRQSVNDVDYLSCEASKTHGMPTFIAIDEYDSLSECVPHIDDVLAQPNWLSDSVPQITQDDLQLIFIKNLSNVLIQRMQTMDRFSDDDYAIGGNDLKAWDIVFEPLTSTFGLFTGKHEYQKIGSFLFFTNPSKTVVDWDMATAAFTKTRTITESEMKDFREVLETCYA